MSKRILVVDDEPDLIQVVRVTLQTKGYTVEDATDGQEALRKIERNRPDLVLLDLMMPVMSGLEVVRRLKKNEETRDIPIIVMSAAGKDSGKPEEFFREGLGSDDFIAKPFDPLNLLGRVEAVLRMRDYRPPPSDAAVPGQDALPPTTATAGGVKLDELPTLGPAEIVKAFVEAWNTQDFAVEFRCLAPAMTANLPQTDYVQRRQQAFADDRDADRNQRVKRVVEMSAEDDEARVVVERKDTVRGRSSTHRQEFQLVRGETNWQIKMVRPLNG